MAETKETQVTVRFDEYLTDKLTSIESALPKDFNRVRFVQNCLALRNDNADIKNANPSDVINGLLKGAYMGLDFFSKECYLIKRGNSMVFQTDYKGEIKFVKAYSTRPIKDIYAKVVRQGDDFREKVIDGEPSIDFEPLPFNDGDIVGAFAICKFADGGMLYETMSIKDIQAVRNNYSACKNSKAWTNSLDEMCKKTVLRRLTKHIDKNVDSVEALKAYEEGTEMNFNSKPIPSDIVSNPFSTKEELAEDENVIDVEAVEVDPSTIPSDDVCDELPFK